MPPEGEKLDELLSGYIDGALNEKERQIVEQAAQDDVRVSQRILQLRQQAADVAYLGSKLAQQLPRPQAGSSQAAVRRSAVRWRLPS
jgi:anti-sigma factor RsiW